MPSDWLVTTLAKPSVPQRELLQLSCKLPWSIQRQLSTWLIPAAMTTLGLRLMAIPASGLISLYYSRMLFSLFFLAACSYWHRLQG